MSSEKKLDYFVSFGILKFLITIFKNSKDDLIKTETLKLLFNTSYKSSQEIKELDKLNITNILSEEFINHTKGIKKASDFTISLLDTIKSILGNNPNPKFNEESFINS